MNMIVTIICMLVLCSYVKAAENCDELGVLVYEDIGCRPVSKEGKECPVKYECDNFQTNDTCKFRGRSLKIGERLDGNLTYASCNIGCFCDNSGKFTCAALDCPEWLGRSVDPGCYLKYEVGSCCSVGQNCHAGDSSLGNCVVDGNTLMEGQEFTPKNTCLTCVCPANFNGKYETPQCQRISCGIQIHYSQELQKKCAPVFGKSDQASLCCPVTWICPNDSMEYSPENEELVSDMACQFGDKEIKLGGGLTSKFEFFGKERNISCKCALPPLLTCKEI